MARDTRQRMIEGAVRLLAQRGPQDTSFSDVIELTGAPRGSIYHHFPEGKDQLIASAVDLAGARAIELINRSDGASAVEVTLHFLGMWRELLIASKFRAGCSVLAVTVATESSELLEHASSVFRSWRLRLAELLTTGGLDEADALRFSALLVSASEGAVVLSRAEQSLDPFDLVAAQLEAQVRAMSGAGIPPEPPVS